MENGYQSPKDLFASKKAAARALKKLNARVDAICQSELSGVQVRMLDLPKIANVGREIAQKDGTDDEIRDAVKKYIETIRCN